MNSDITFYKYHGAGNDFIIIDARTLKLSIFTETLIYKMCDRHFGIGADGLMLLLPDKKFDFSMKYYNSDGKEGSMCGNGGRCITAFARDLGLIKSTTTFSAIDGIHSATINKDGTISLAMQNVNEIFQYADGVYVNTGSPHFVVSLRNPHTIDTYAKGKKIRYSKEFAPEGTNVNFVKFGKKKLIISTYERGVENETLACGTGAVAAAIIANYSFFPKKESFTLVAKGGNLIVTFKKIAETQYADIVLTGDALQVFEGKVKLNSLI